MLLPITWNAFQASDYMAHAFELPNAGQRVQLWSKRVFAQARAYFTLAVLLLPCHYEVTRVGNGSVIHFLHSTAAKIKQ